MHKNEFHAVLSPRNAEAVPLTVAAQCHAMKTAAQTAKRFRQLYAQSQHFFVAPFSLCAFALSFTHFAIAFAERSLTPADLNSPHADAAKAANFSYLPAVVLH